MPRFVLLLAVLLLVTSLFGMLAVAYGLGDTTGILQSGRAAIAGGPGVVAAPPPWRRRCQRS